MPLDIRFYDPDGAGGWTLVNTVTLGEPGTAATSTVFPRELTVSDGQRVEIGTAGQTSTISSDGASISRGLYFKNADPTAGAVADVEIAVVGDIQQDITFARQDTEQNGFFEIGVGFDLVDTSFALAEENDVNAKIIIEDGVDVGATSFKFAIPDGGDWDQVVEVGNDVSMVGTFQLGTFVTDPTDAHSFSLTVGDNVTIGSGGTGSRPLFDIGFPTDATGNSAATMSGTFGDNLTLNGGIFVGGPGFATQTLPPTLTFGSNPTFDSGGLVGLAQTTGNTQIPGQFNLWGNGDGDGGTRVQDLSGASFERITNAMFGNGPLGDDSIILRDNEFDWEPRNPGDLVGIKMGAGNDTVIFDGGNVSDQSFILSGGGSSGSVAAAGFAQDSYGTINYTMDAINFEAVNEAQRLEFETNLEAAGGTVNADGTLTIPDGISWSVRIYDAAGNPTANTVTFQEFETGTLSVGPPPPALDDLVEGTAGADVITLAYTGDPEGDRIDNSDSTNLFGEGSGTENDSIQAFGGNDTVAAGAGSDTVEGGTGDDSISGEAGNDSLSGDFGADTILGGGGDDFIKGDFANVYNADFEAASGLPGGFGNWSAGQFLFTTNRGDGVVDDGTGNHVYRLTGESSALQSSFQFGSIGTSQEIPVSVTLTNDGPTDATFQLTFRETGTNVVTQTVVVPANSGTNDYVLTFDGPALRTLIGTATENQNFSVEISNLTAGTTIDVDNIFGASAGNEDSLDGGDGNDTIYGAFGDDVISGGIGNDRLLGGAQNDSISGDAGNDLIQGGWGADTLLGDEGNDTLSGSLDNDTLDGGAGEDVLSGGDGNDTVRGGADNDTVSGGGGNDSLLGEGGVDSLVGGSGADFLDGGSENDILEDRYGSDTLIGGDGADSITSYYGDDSVLGGAGNDTINIGTSYYDYYGADVVDGGTGADIINTNQGDDTINLSDGFGADTIDGGENTGDLDVLDASAVTEAVTVTFAADPEDGTVAGATSGTANFANIENVIATDLNDTIDGSASTGPINVDAGGGDDTVTGGTGNDTVDGGAGNDSIDGGAGDDNLTGGAGADTIDGGAGDDTVDLGANDGVADEVVFEDGDGNDTVNNFEDPTDNGDGTFTGTDQVDVSGLTDTNGDPVTTDTTTVTAPGGVLTLTFPNGETLTFPGVDPTPFTTAGTQEAALNAIGIPSNTPPPDDLVLGTAGNDVIDVNYTGDPEGDRVDSSDATGLWGETVGGQADSIQGGAGNDTITAGADNDTIVGGTGDDVISGGTGNDVIDEDSADVQFVVDDWASWTGSNIYPTGGSNLSLNPGGNASFDFATTPGETYTITYSSSSGGTAPYTHTAVVDGTTFTQTQPTSSISPNTLTFTATQSTTTVEFNHVTGNFFNFDNFTLEGQTVPDGNDSIDGDAGDDIILAGVGNDTVSGGADNDQISGGTGIDNLSGDAGQDTIGGGLGADSIDGGEGNDVITGGDGGDTITGGGGNDLIVETTVNEDFAGDFSAWTFTGAASATGGQIILANSGNTASYDLDTVVGQEYTVTFDAITNLTNIGTPLNPDVSAATISATGSDPKLVNNLNSDLSQPLTYTFVATAATSTITFTSVANAPTRIEDVSISSGTDGADVIDAGAGDDTVVAAEGNDTIDGGAGADNISGGVGNDAITVGGGDNAAGNDDNDAFTLDAANIADGDVITIDGGTGGTTDVDSISVTGLTNLTFTGVTTDADGDSTSGTFTATDSDGDNFTVNFTEIEMICFAKGTLIKTAEGEVPVEDLKAGDLIITMDQGYQELQWIGSKKLDSIDLQMQPRLKPIVIQKNALGDGFPTQDLLVSPQHRILVRSQIAQRMFGTNEVLIPANKLLTLDGIDIQDENPEGVEYFHMLFDAHQIVWSNGAPTESLFTGPQALKAVSPEARAEIEALFPEICEPDFDPAPARHIPEKGKLMKKLAQRHHANQKPLMTVRTSR